MDYSENSTPRLGRPRIFPGAPQKHALRLGQGGPNFPCA